MTLAALVAIGGCAREIGDEGDLGVTEAAILNGDDFDGDTLENGFVQIFPGTGPNPDGTSSMCSGTLLTNRWVLTAAHCFMPADTSLPSATSVIMNGQPAHAARQILIHPGGTVDEIDGVDVALVELQEPFVMNGRTAGYEQGIYAGQASDLVGRPIHCIGFGNFVEEGASGVLRHAILQPDAVIAGPRYRIPWNGVNQMMYKGDSGASCFWEEHGTRQIVLVHSATYDPPHEAQTNESVPASSFRDWVLDVLRQQPVDFANDFPRPLPDYFTGSRDFDPCGGACWSWVADFQFETNYDYGYVDGVALTGDGVSSGTACGPVSIDATTDYSVLSQGFRSLTATCGPHIACHGPDCRTGELPPGTWISQEWDPCNGFCFQWTLEFEGGPGSVAGVDGAYYGGWTYTSGESCGEIPLVLYTSNSPGELRLRAQCDPMTVDPIGTGAQSEGAGIAIGDLENDGLTDLFTVAYDAPAGPNEFRVHVAQNLTAGRPASYLIGTFPGVGDIGEGAGIAVTSLDGDPAPELVLMAYDAAPGANDFRLRVLRNVHVAWSATGPFLEAGVIGPIQVVPGVGYTGHGAGIAIGHVTGSPNSPDLVLAAFDGAMEHRYRVVADLSPAGLLGAPGPIQMAARAPRTDIGEVHGSGVTLAQLDADPDLEIVLGTYHWYGEQHAQFRYQIGWDFSSAGTASDWTFYQMPGVGTRGAGMDIAFGQIDAEHQRVLVLAANDDGDSVDAMRWRYVTHDLRD